MENMLAPKELDVSNGDWDLWIDEFEIYLRATEKYNKPNNVKVGLLLHFVGQEGRKLFKTFKFIKEGDKDNYGVVIEHFKEYFQRNKNIIFSRFNFFSLRQKENQNVDSFITDLKCQAAKCEFGVEESNLVRDLLVIGLRDKSAQTRLLMEKSLTLEEAGRIVKAIERSEGEAKRMQGEAKNSIEEIRKYEPRNKSCGRCCGQFHDYNECPARGRKCAKCGRFNHFASACLSKKQMSYSKNKNVRNKDVRVNALEEDNKELSEGESGSGSEASWRVNSMTTCEKRYVNSISWSKSIKVENIFIEFKLDCGSEVNIITKRLYDKIKNPPNLFNSNKVLLSYSNHQVKTYGYCKLNVTMNEKSKSLMFFVVSNELKPILGLEACVSLDLIRRTDTILTESQINVDDYKDVFSDELGKLPYTYKIKLKENAEPSISAARVIPKALKNAVKTEIERLVGDGVLTKVNEATDWVNPIVVVPKPNKTVRICMDPRKLNKAIKREFYTIPTTEDILSDLSEARYFTILDASNAFLQVPLDKNSSYLCTIATPFGRYRYNRLPFGLCSSPEVFQKAIHQVIGDIDGVSSYIDDIIVYGNNVEEHDLRLRTVLDRCRKHGLKLNKNKIQICKKSIKYLGHVISDGTIAIDKSKINAIVDMETPKNKNELLRFLGMINYLAKFVPSLSDKTSLLRNLLKSKTEFIWENNEQKCFEELKKTITAAPVLKIFNPKLPIVLSVDASQYGLGAVLLQNNGPVAFSSTNLTSTQKRYSQIEKEALAIVNGIKKFHFYLYGNDFKVQTDHKPLLKIFQKNLEELSPRLQRLVMKVLPYRFTLEYVPGKELVLADTLSRSPDHTFCQIDCEQTPSKINSILSITDSRLKQFQDETKQDINLKEVINYVLGGWPEHQKQVPPAIRPYWRLRNDIFLDDSLLFFNNRLIVPHTLHDLILDKLHYDHCGIVACKDRARRYVYWPNISSDIEKFILSCNICLETAASNPRQPMILRDIPQQPWVELAVDFFHVPHTKEDFICLVDYFSKFVEIRKITSKKSGQIVSKLKQIFRTHGIPAKLFSDNGPPFSSHDFNEFMKEYDIHHCTSSPNYPQSNGLVERTIQTVKNLLIKAHKAKRDPNIAILNYNCTSRGGLKPPSEVLMGRSLRSIMPTTVATLNPKFDIRMETRQLEERQQTQKKYYDLRARKIRTLDFKPNQDVMVKQDNRSWKKGKIIRECDAPNSYMIQMEDGGTCRRTRNHIRRIPT